MDSVSPVYTEETVRIERVIALDQPQYSPIVILPVVFDDGTQARALRGRGRKCAVGRDAGRVHVVEGGREQADEFAVLRVAAERNVGPINELIAGDVVREAVRARRARDARGRDRAGRRGHYGPIVVETEARP